MQVHREHSQVRSARTTCSVSAGSTNSIHSRGKSRGTSRAGTAPSLRDRRDRPHECPTLRPMRLGVLDVGSNTVHLLVVDAHRGAQPTPQHSDKAELRLAENLDKHGNLTPRGADALVQAVTEARRQSLDQGCDELLAFATSAVRDA